jgi:hypothetical protein
LSVLVLFLLFLAPLEASLKALAKERAFGLALG